jgi:hypothetical protein
MKNILALATLIALPALAETSQPFSVVLAGTACRAAQCERYDAGSGQATVELFEQQDGSRAGVLEVAYQISGKDVKHSIILRETDGAELPLELNLKMQIDRDVRTAAVLSPSYDGLNYVLLDGPSFKQGNLTIKPELLIGPPSAAQGPFHVTRSIIDPR